MQKVGTVLEARKHSMTNEPKVGTTLNESMTNDSLIIEGTKSPKTIEGTERLAHYLVEKFSNPAGYQFYLKVAWRVDGGTIDRLVATAFEKGEQPAKYFSTCARRAMA
jgi:hypothetical protein